MKYRLARFWANVEHGPVALFNPALSTNFCRGEMQVSNQLSILSFRFLQSADVLFRNDQHMCGSLRRNVLKRERMLVLVNFSGGNLSANDLAE